MSDKLFSTTVYYNAVVSGDKYAAQTVISSDDKAQYEEAMSDFFSTLAAKVDENGAELFVSFESRAVASAAAPRAAGAAPAGPLPDAPTDVPNCPIHKVALKQKTNRRTGQQFFSCSERTADGYCNWTPPQGR